VSGGIKRKESGGKGETMTNDLDKKVVNYEDYAYFSSPKGRLIARRIQKYKQRLFWAYTSVTILFMTVGGLVFYILKSSEGG
jgi:hypothetical protein